MSLLVQNIQIHLRSKRVALGSCAEVKRPLFVPIAQPWAGGTREGRNPACLIFSLLSTVELHTCVCSCFASRPRINAREARRRLMTFTPTAIIVGGTKMTKGEFVTWKTLVPCTMAMIPVLFHSQLCQVEQSNAKERKCHTRSSLPGPVAQLPHPKHFVHEIQQ